MIPAPIAPPLIAALLTGILAPPATAAGEPCVPERRDVAPATAWRCWAASTAAAREVARDRLRDRVRQDEAFAAAWRVRVARAGARLADGPEESDSGSDLVDLLALAPDAAPVVEWLAAPAVRARPDLAAALAEAAVEVLVAAGRHAEVLRALPQPVTRYEASLCQLDRLRADLAQLGRVEEGLRLVTGPGRASPAERLRARRLALRSRGMALARCLRLAGRDEEAARIEELAAGLGPAPDGRPDPTGFTREFQRSR